MKHIASIFIALSLCTLPCFATAEQSPCTTAANAKTAELKQIGNTMVCVPTECKCGYDLKDNKCIKLETKKCTHSDPDALTAYEVYEETEGKCEPKCRIKTCKLGFSETNSDQCIKDSKDSKGQTTPQPRDDGNADQSQQGTKNYIKNAVATKFCKDKGLTLTDKCNEATPTVIAGCTEYIREARNELENALKNYCFTNKTNVVEIDDEKTNTKKLKEAKKQEETNKLINACKTGNKGTWDDTKGKCTCKNSEHIFDKTEGCIAETKASTTAKQDLEKLKNNLTEALEKIAQANNG